MPDFNIDMADTKPSVISFLTVGVMAVTFILLAKYMVNRYPIAGLTEAINAV